MEVSFFPVGRDGLLILEKSEEILILASFKGFIDSTNQTETESREVSDVEKSVIFGVDRCGVVVVGLCDSCFPECSIWSMCRENAGAILRAERDVVAFPGWAGGRSKSGFCGLRGWCGGGVCLSL